MNATLGTWAVGPMALRPSLMADLMCYSRCEGENELLQPVPLMRAQHLDLVTNECVHI